MKITHICPTCSTPYMISKPLNQYLCINNHLFREDERKLIFDPTEPPSEAAADKG